MKRSENQTDEEWDQLMNKRKTLAEERMKASDSFQTIKDIYTASMKWYGNSNKDNLCYAENRLMRGEKPPANTDDKQ